MTIRAAWPGQTFTVVSQVPQGSSPIVPDGKRCHPQIYCCCFTQRFHTSLVKRPSSLPSNHLLVFLYSILGSRLLVARKDLSLYYCCSVKCHMHTNDARQINKNNYLDLPALNYPKMSVSQRKRSWPGLYRPRRQCYVHHNCIWQ